MATEPISQPSSPGKKKPLICRFASDHSPGTRHIVQGSFLAINGWASSPISGHVVCRVLAYIFFGLILFARATNHWQTNMPQSVYMNLVPRANQLTHPGCENRSQF